MSLKVEQMETDTKIAPAIKQETEDESNLDVLASQNVVIKEDIKDVKEIQPNDVIEDESKMDVDTKDLPVSIEKKVEDPVNFSIKETEPGLMELSIDGIEDNDDDDETVVLSPEEVRTYLEDKIKEYLTDPKINPLFELTKRSQELQEEFKEKNEEYNKLNKLLQLIYRQQEKFLRHMGILEKIPTKSIAISADLPVEPDALNCLSNNAQESLRRNAVAQNAIPASTQKKVFPPTSITSVTKELPKATEAGKTNTSKPTNSSIECIDLTDELDPPNTSVANRVLNPGMMLKHPAPLPSRPVSTINLAHGMVPPKPRLKVNAEDRGIVLQWDMPPNIPPHYAKLCAFDIFGYQEQPNAQITTLLWKKIGSVKAMTLPMACTLTQFLEGNKYHFAIRAVDVHSRPGSYSDPISIVYTMRAKKT